VKLERAVYYVADRFAPTRYREVVLTPLHSDPDIARGSEACRTFG